MSDDTLKAAAERLRNIAAGHRAKVVYGFTSDPNERMSSDDCDHITSLRQRDESTLSRAYLAEHPADGEQIQPEPSDDYQRIDRLIERLQEIRELMGNTCVFISKLSWGAAALWDYRRQEDGEQAIDEAFLRAMGWEYHKALKQWASGPPRDPIRVLFWPGNPHEWLLELNNEMSEIPDQKTRRQLLDLLSALGVPVTTEGRR